MDVNVYNRIMLIYSKDRPPQTKKMVTIFCFRTRVPSYYPHPPPISPAAALLIISYLFFPIPFPHSFTPFLALQLLSFLLISSLSFALLLSFLFFLLPQIRSRFRGLLGVGAEEKTAAILFG